MLCKAIVVTLLGIIVTYLCIDDHHPAMHNRHNRNTDNQEIH